MPSFTSSTRLFRKCRVRREANAGDREIGIERVPSANVARTRCVVDRPARQSDASSAYIDPIRTMQIQQEIRHHLRQRAGAQARRAFQYRCSTPSLRAVAATSRPIQPPPTTSTRALLRSRRAKRHGFVERTQIGDVRCLHQRFRQAPRGAAGRDHQPVILHFTALTDVRTMRCSRSIARRAIRLPCFDIQRVEIIGRNQPHGFDIALRRQAPPSTAAGARTANESRRRSSQGGRRSLPCATSSRPNPPPVHRRSQRSCAALRVRHGGLSLCSSSVSHFSAPS